MSNQPSVHAAKLVEIVSAAQNETKSAVAEMKAAVQQRDSALTAAKDAKTELRKIQSQELQVKSHLDAAKEIIDMKEKDLVALREKHAKTVKALLDKETEMEQTRKDMDAAKLDFIDKVRKFGVSIHGGAGAGAGDDQMASPPAHSHFGAGGVRHDTPFPQTAGTNP